MIVSLPTEASLDRYVQVSIMAKTRWGGSENDEYSDWLDPPGSGSDCDCGGPPPPLFMIPPPPKPPPFPPSPSSVENVPFTLFEDPIEDCEDVHACPALLGAREDQRPNQPSRTHLAVVIISASTLLVIVLIAAAIVCRLRGRGRSAKSCTELSGAIIYDDLPSAPSIVPARNSRPRFKPVPNSDEVMGMTMGVHLYTPEPRSHAPSEHLYQSISSGSETCSYSTSEPTGQDGRALLRLHHHHHHHHGGRGGGVGRGRGSPMLDSDSEDEGLASQGMLVGVSDNDTPSTSPSRSRYYCASAPPPQTQTSSPRSSDYESVYYVGGLKRGRPPTPQERGLPPLPSRTDRFRMYFSVDRAQQYHMAPMVPMGPNRRVLMGNSGHKRHNDRHGSHRAPLPSEAEPLYENLQ